MRILVVDDEEKFAGMVADDLREAGHDVTALFSGEEALKAVPLGFDVVVTDLKMVPVDGIAVLEAAKAANPETEVILVTGNENVESAVRAFRLGAYDYLVKGASSLEELHALLARIGDKQGLRRENAALRQELASGTRFDEMVGTSAAMAKVADLVAKVAPSEATVLVLGESGAGKELVARMIHRKSRRAQKAFVVVHAAALPENLLESELFGYEKGAFTGAAARKPGRLEMAEGGTLFLDEIGEISPAFQVELLRFLQEKTFTRLGGAETIKVDTRIVAATNRKLEEEVQARRFREDLYYRLAVFPVTVPPLRERRSDIPQLCRHIIRRLGASFELRPDVLELLAGHDWPGNVRELENVLERALILSAGGEIRPQHIQLPEAVLVRSEPGDSRPGSLPDMEKAMLEDALRKAGGNKSKAAKLLGITRRMLYTKMAKFGLATDDELDGE